MKNEKDDLERRFEKVKETSKHIEIHHEKKPDEDLILKLKTENEKLKKELEIFNANKNKKDDDLKKKKKALLNELVNMITSKNNFENGFYAELTDTSEIHSTNQLQEHRETHISKKVSKKTSKHHH